MTIQSNLRYVCTALLLLILSACAPAGPGVPVTGETAVAAITSIPALPTGLSPELMREAQEWLAAQINVLAEEVKIVEVEQVEWTDSCLGLGQLNESCLAAPTPGWRAIFEVNGQRYEVRTDDTGSTFRLAP